MRLPSSICRVSAALVLRSEPLANGLLIHRGWRIGSRVVTPSDWLGERITKSAPRAIEGRSFEQGLRQIS
jgi:hypothetical protein